MKETIFQKSVRECMALAKSIGIECDEKNAARIVRAASSLAKKKEEISKANKS